MQFGGSIFIFLTIILNNQLFSQNYEIKNDSLNASGWFGGDDRPGQQRNVAIAQSVFIDEPINLETFSFYFTSPFDSVNGLLSGHEVALKLHIRDSLGIILNSESIVVTDTFTNGWVTWSEINFNIPEAGKYIFSTYLIGGFDSNQVHSGLGSDLNAGYVNGEMYVKYVSNDDEAELWDDWSIHSWDTNFWLSGSIIATSVEHMGENVFTFKLNQNYPNPFNPSTKISWQSSIGSWHTLKVYNLLGNELATLVNDYKPAGIYEVEFNAANLPGGVYFYELRIGNFSETKKLVLLK